MAEKTPVEQLTYKQASQELELIIRSLESGDMELEESLESYTRGVELLKSLRTRLSDAEQKVSVLLKDVDGNDVLADGEAANTDDNLSFYLGLRERNQPCVIASSAKLPTTRSPRPSFTRTIKSSPSTTSTPRRRSTLS